MTIMINLTDNAVPAICATTNEKPADLRPVVQIIDLKRVNFPDPSGGERFRVVVSDGIFHQHGMLASQLNDLVRSGRLQIGSIVQLTEFTCGNVQNRLIIIILSLNVLLERCDLVGASRQFSAPVQNGH